MFVISPLQRFLIKSCFNERNIWLEWSIFGLRNYDLALFQAKHSIQQTDRHDITKIFLKVALNTITLTLTSNQCMNNKVIDSVLGQPQVNLNFYIIHFYTPVFKTGRIMVYQCPIVRPSVSHVAL